MTERILIAEDEQVLRTNLCELLQRAGYDVEGVPDGEAALQRATQEDFALVITDIRMPRMDGITLLKRLVEERPETAVLIITAYASIESAVEALRFGAFDYLLKPIVFEDLLQKISNLLSFRALKDEVSRLRRDLQQRLGFEGIVGSGPSIQHLFELIDKVAPTLSTVLITGESGTGKELVARAIHSRSGRSDKTFLAVNVGAIPPDLVESQLFGHERGAFTGATRARKGLLRSAHGGTIFLDEVGELPLAAQAKLLRALDQKEILPVGVDRPIRVDVRLLAATNQRLEAAIEARRFREDLYYRLNVFRIEVPTLRERREDIPALVQHFLRQHGRSVGHAPKGVANEAMRLLLAYSWPGNVRELSNIVERAIILAGSAPVGPEHLPSEFRARGQAPTALREAVEDAERRHIQWVLRAVDGNREKAAELLEVDRATLYRRLAKYELI